MFWIIFAAFLVIGYLAGSLNFSIIITKLKMHSDIRNYGSGNAGGTNTVRVLGKKWGILVILLDALKCVAVILAARLVYYLAGLEVLDSYLALIGIACILGHLFPLYYKFKGGKGIACTAGVMLAINPAALGLLFLIWAIVVVITRYVSLGSIIGGALIPLFIWLLSYNRPDRIALTVIFAAVAAILIISHRQNIKRLLNGTENRFGSKKGKEVQ